MKKLYNSLASFAAFPVKLCTLILVLLGLWTPASLQAEGSPGSSGKPIEMEAWLWASPNFFGSVTSLTANPATIWPCSTSTISANGLTGGSARQWWIDVGAANGTYQAGTDINLGTGSSIVAMGNTPNFPANSTVTVWMREIVSNGGMPETFTTTMQSTTLTIRPLPALPPAGNAVCRNDNPIDLLTLVPTALSFSGSGVAGTTFTPSNVVPNNAPNVVITVTYACPIPGNGATTAQMSISIFDPPNATINDYATACRPGASGTASLLPLLTNATTPGGVFTLISGSGSITENELDYNAPGCYQIRYTLTNPNGCDNPDLTDDAFLLITEAPATDFSIGSGATDCFETGSPARTITVTPNVLPPGGTYEWSATASGGLNVTVTNPNSATPTITIDFNGAPDYSAGEVEICLTETIPAPAGMCGSLASPGSCATIVCKSFSIVQLPNCDNDCPGIEGIDPCDIDVNPNFTFACSFFSIDLGQVFVADVHGAPGQEEAISCTTEEICVEYDAQFEIGGLSQQDLPSFSDLPLVDGLCDLLQFCICVDLGFLGDIEIRPFGWIPSSFCDDDILTFLLDAFGNGQGYQVWADTDGDGSFDTMVDEQNLSNQLTNCVPNNVPGQGTITVRIVGSASGAPSGPCQDPATPVNMLDLLPIKAIPIIGNTLEYLLEVAGCGADIGFSDYDDYQVFVYNDQPPSFVNCPASYKFSDGPNCSAFVNWSAPVATDNCDYSVVNNVIQLTNSADWPNTIAANQTLTSGQFVAYQPGGNNDYTIVYEATACNDLKSYCSFTVSISPGQQPGILCPANLAINTDVDLCTKVVTGITPLDGLGSCDAVMTWRAWDGIANVPAPGDIFATGNNDASGTVFPLGTNTVEYTLVAPDENGVSTTQTCSFRVTVNDNQLPTIACQDITVQLDNNGDATVTTAQVDGGSSDNCGPVTLSIQKGTGAFGPQVTFNCFDAGSNTVTLRAVDGSGNARNCLAQVIVKDFFDGYVLDMDVPEICLEANNPSQLNFANYLTITRPNGTTIPHSLIGTLGPNVGGYFGITAFGPAPGSGTTLGSSPANPGDIGYVDPTTGIYTPGTGSGFVTISYLMTIGAQIAQDGAIITGCFEIVHDVFELRQPLDMGSPECMCFDGEERIVDLGVISGGLEPYTIQYTGVRLDTDGNGVSDDSDGEYVYDAANGHNINDFTQDLGELRVVYTQPVWSFTIVDARGCELFRSGSCDNDDFTEGPQIPCNPTQIELNTEPFLCESQYSWQHPLPTDNCKVVLYDYRITNPDGTIDGPHNLDALLNIAPGSPIPSFFTATYEFQLGLSVVSYYAEDAQGNFATCTFAVNVTDDDPPYFINCPYPDVVQDAEPNQCDAYVNFALPLAADNCDMPVVTQIDLTGFATGDRFDVGLTVLYYEAVDLAGNRDTCRVKVIVNDYGRIPELTCPGDKSVDNDPWLCSAVVNNIAPIFDGPCKDNLAVTYSIYADAALTQRKECGVWDASGEFFDDGNSWVQYTVHSQPLLLITEVNQSANTDRIEITNFGPADLDITCLMVSRTSTNLAANQNLAPVDQLPSLAPTIVPVGGVYVFNFAFNGAANMPACYTVAFKGNLIDEVAVNGAAGCGNFTGTLAGGDVIRMCEDDSDDAKDWSLAQLCSPLSIGVLNPGLDIMPDNGTLTSLQSIIPNRNTCVFKVDVNDVEDPFCGKLDGTTTFNGGPIVGINPNACNQSTVSVPNTNDCIIGNIVFNLTGTATPANSKITLISPKGIRVNINELPKDTIPELFAQKAAGTWTLDIVPLIGTPTVTGWTLQITCLDTFDLADQVKGNDPGQCGANFTWTHPYFVDNCFDGTITVAYSTNDADCVPAGGLLLNKGGYLVTRFFCVGTTKVTYTLVDAAGNVEQCDFNVTINDIEKPVVVCPQDIIIHLGGGECGAFVNYQPVFTSDNCEVVDTVMTPPSGSWFTIGIHVVTITVFDEAGNTQTCTFKVNIIEHIPSSSVLVCNDLENVSLDSTCIYMVNADAALEGDDYHCYDDYIITIKNNLGQIVGNTFNASHIGKIYTVTVLDPETGNTCWTTMKIEDKLAPALTCPPAVTVSCSESTAIANTGNVVIKDCTNTSTQAELNIADNGECGDPRQIITRTFIVTDAWGNQSSCSQTITVEKFDFADLQFPADVTINCEDTYLNPGAVAPASTGRPSVNGAPIGAGGLCSTSIGYWDEKLDICFGSYEILRTWKVANTCLPLSSTNPVEHTQRIRIKDFGGPQFACPGDTTVSVDPNICCATAALPDMIISEGCSGIVALEARVSGTDPATGNYITFTVPGYLANFPGNNFWNPDTLAKFSYTQCLPRGVYTVRYTAKDGCENISICEFQMTVADLVPPVVACDEFTQVALGADGMAFVNATTFDDGSIDNCAPVFFKVRRMDTNTCEPNTEFKNQVKFCCSDIGDTLTVVLRVYDEDPGAGTVALEGTAGNYNDCMVQVLVEDKIKPICTAPANVVVECESFDPSLWAYGQATATDNCCIDTITYQVVLNNFDSLCNRGTITRRWTAIDCGGNTSQCSQRVIVTYNQDYYVKFPADRLISTCDGTGNYGAPEFYGEDCELLATSFVDEIFTVVPDACFKIERTWTVINWCTFNPNVGCTYVPNPTPSNTSNAPANLAGVTVSAPGTTILNWTPTVVKINASDPTATNYSTFWSANANCYQYKQIIKIYDTQDPSVVTPTPGEYCDYSTNDASFWNNSYWYDATIASHDMCEGDANIEITATDACSGALLNFRYLLFLDLDGDGNMETVVNSVNPPGFNNIQYNNANNANYGGGESRQFDFRPVPGNQQYGFGLQVDAAVGVNRAARVRWFNQLGQNAVPQLPYGTHKIKWFIEDGCGNEYITEQTLVVKDCKKPTVVCINGLSINLMNTTPPMVQLWASDFLQYTEDNCTPSAQIKIGIRRSGTGTGFPTNADGTPQTSVQFDCSDLGTQLVELWAIDKAGNADFCETYVLIQDNTGACGGTDATIAGTIATDLQEGVQDATVEMEGVANGLPQFGTVFSNVSGDYAFSNALPFGSDYTVTPTLELDPLNGVNTYDLILISRHILGLEPLNTPYKLISADANKSGTVTTFDVVELRKLILGTYTELPNNSSWRFVDKTQVFADPNNPFAETIRENISVSQIQASEWNDDFVAAKVGDVDNTSVPNQLVSTDDRTTSTLLFDIEDRDVPEGETFTVSLTADQIVKGYQFTLNLNGLEAVGLESGTATEENFGIFTSTSLGNQGAVTTSWDAPATFNGKAQFTFRFKATKSGQLSTMLSVSSRITKAVAFDQTASKMDIGLRFNNKGVSTITGLGFELYQNTPNPWTTKTQIGFHLPEATTATLTIYDVTGRTLYTTKGDFAKGYNYFSIDRKMVETVGNLFYKVETSTDSGVKQMIEMK